MFSADSLQKSIKGDVMTSNLERELYSCDPSIYKIIPEVIVAPKDKNDVVFAVKWAREAGLPITCRAGGTSLDGACQGKGLILDFSRYMAKIGKIRKKGKDYFVKVEPGVIYKQLNNELASNKFFLPPTPASEVACMLGGNVGTKASGMRAVKYGTIDAFVNSLEFITAEGKIVNTAAPQDLKPLDSELRQIEALRAKIKNDKNSLKILKSKKDLQTTSGYNIFSLLDYSEIRNILTHLLVGSVGTLGIFTEIELKIQPLAEKKPLSCALFLKNLSEIEPFIKEAKKLKCSSLEFIDAASLQFAQKKFPQIEIPKNTEIMMLAEFDEEPDKKINALEKICVNFNLAGEITTESENKEKMDLLWKIRKALLPLAATYSFDTKPITVSDDVGITNTYFADLLLDIRKILSDLKIPAVVYGHAGVGTIHIDPALKVTDKNGLKLAKEMADKIFNAALKYNGTICSEHGMGRTRTAYLKKEWGENIYNYMKKIKNIFDPEDILNPGVMFHRAEPQETIFGMQFVSKYEWPCMNCRYCVSGCPAWIRERWMCPPNFKNMLRQYALQKQTPPAELNQIKKELAKCVLCGNCTRACSNGADIKSFNEEWKNKLSS